MAPPMNGTSRARMPDTVRIVPRFCGAACWACSACCWTPPGTWGSVMAERLSIRLYPTILPMMARRIVSTKSSSGTKRPCFTPERLAILPATYPPIRKATNSVTRSPMRAAVPAPTPTRPRIAPTTDAADDAAQDQARPQSGEQTEDDARPTRAQLVLPPALFGLAFGFALLAYLPDPPRGGLGARVLRPALPGIGAWFFPVTRVRHLRCSLLLKRGANHLLERARPSLAR